MTDSEINKIIAEYIQWKPAIIPRDMTGKPFEGWDIPPDYCRDLNAMHEAEKILFTTNNWDACAYEAALQKETTSWAWHSTAKQRAQTFLKTIGKWKD
jgi:hypothetical protein